MLKQFKTGQWLYYSNLPPHAQQMYMVMYKGILQKQTQIDVPVPKHNGVFPPADYLLELLLQVVRDNPELYYFDATNVSYQYLKGEYQRIYRIFYTDYYSDHQEEQILKTLLMRTDLLLQETAGMTPEEKVRYFHDHLMKHVKYMYSVQRVDTLENLEARTVVGPLLNHLGVCAGIAKAFQLLCDQAGIPCFYLSGKAKGMKGWDNHGWNVVRLNGNYYHVDVTWDCSEFQKRGIACYQYFLRGDRFMSKSRTWDRSLFPEMTKDFRQSAAGEKVKSFFGNLFS